MKGWIALAGLLGVGCVPSAARKHARVRPGVDVEVNAGLQYVGPNEEDPGSSSGDSAFMHLELDVQYGRQRAAGDGFAVQLKLPLNYLFSAIDLYYQAPPLASGLYAGVGAELSVFPSVYGVITQELRGGLFVSLTPRILFTNIGDEPGVLLNPQLSFGLSKSLEVSGFVSLARHTGRGFDFHVDLFSDTNETDYRRQFALVGAAIRF